MSSIDQDGFHHRFFDVSGVRLHAALHGPPKGDLVVLLHGFPEYWGAWKHQLRALADAGFYAVAPDLRGYNLSDRPAGVAAYSIEKLSGDVAALIRALGRDQAVVVGHDWGGGVAWDVAMRFPDVVKKLVVMNCPHPKRMADGLRNARQMRKSWYMFFFQIPWLPERLLATDDYRGLRRTFAKILPPAEVEGFIEAARNAGGLRGGVNYYRAMFRKIWSPSMKKEVIRPIQCPVRVLWGRPDAFLGDEIAEPPTDLVPHARTVWIDGGTHWVQNKAPERVNEELISFVRPNGGHN